MDKNIKDDLTYMAPGGKRKMRRYVVAALIMIVVAVLLIAGGIYLHDRQTAQVAPVVPTAGTSETPTATTIGTIALAGTVTPASTSDACPTDASAWQLVQVGYNNQYDRMDPTCAYDSLGRTIAWVLAINMGYSRADANALLGFSFDASQNNPAMVKVQSLTILTMSNWAIAKQNMFSSPTNLDFTEWGVTADGSAPSITFSNQGCFQPRTIVGNQIQDWGDGYSFICVIAMDTKTGYHVTSFGGHLYTGKLAPAYRLLALFGYAGNGRWVWLGTEDGVQVDQSTIDPAELQKGYQIESQALMSPTWDAQWVKDNYGIEMKPMPSGWQTANIAAELQAILDLVNKK